MKQKQLFSFLMFWDNPKHVDEKIVRAFKSDHEALKHGFDNRDDPGGRSIAWLADRLGVQRQRLSRINRSKHAKTPDQWRNK